MRVGEAIALDRGDADLDGGVLTVRTASSGKSRLVPLHDTTARALGRYLQLRDSALPGPRHPAFLISPAGTRLLYCNVHATWKKLAASAGLKPGQAPAGPASTTCGIMRTAGLCALP